MPRPLVSVSFGFSSRCLCRVFVLGACRSQQLIDGGEGSLVRFGDVRLPKCWTAMVRAAALQQIHLYVFDTSLRQANLVWGIGGAG